MATPTVYVICDQNCKFESMTKEQILAAITQAVSNGTIGDVDTGFVQTIKTINGTPLRFFVGEQSAYNDLPDEDKENLFAIITNDTTKDGILSFLSTLEDDLVLVGNQVAGIINGDIPAKNATNADCDDLGNKIRGTYAPISKAFAKRTMQDISRDIVRLDYDSGFLQYRIFVGNIPTGKTINDILAISFLTYDSTHDETHHFQGMRTKQKETDGNGDYVEFHCVRSGGYGAAAYGINAGKQRYIDATAVVRIYEIDGKSYFVAKGSYGTVTFFGVDEGNNMKGETYQLVHTTEHLQTTKLANVLDGATLKYISAVYG